jgi:hypothetical protein
MLDWLNQYAGAVQAIMAVIIGVLTAVLIGVTCWYAVLTRRMARTMERQLAASFQPDINLSLSNRFHGSSSNYGVRGENASITIVITNKGNVPVKIAAVAMKVIFRDKSRPEEMIELDAEQRVVAPGQATEFNHLTVELPLGSINGDFERRIQIHCSDLAGISKHTFSMSDISQDITNHSLGFQPL